MGEGEAVVMTPCLNTVAWSWPAPADWLAGQAGPCTPFHTHYGSLDVHVGATFTPLNWHLSGGLNHARRQNMDHTQPRAGGPVKTAPLPLRSLFSCDLKHTHMQRDVVVMPLSRLLMHATRDNRQ